MITYQYKARDKSGKLVQGEVQAESEDALVGKLRQMEYLPIAVTVKAGASSDLGKFFMKLLPGKRVKFVEINMFTRQLFALQKAGLPIVSSLHAIKDQTTNETLKEAISSMVKEVESGNKLSQALEKYPHIFNGLYVNMIASAEVSGRLSEVLDRLVILGEHDEEIRTQVKSAMRYPLIVVCAITIAFFVLITFIVPRYEAIYSQFEATLPLPTRFLLAANYAITNFWWLMIALAIGGALLLRKVFQTQKGIVFLSSLQLKIPVFGNIFLRVFMSRFCRITGTLMKSGVPILQILTLVKDGIGNVVVSRVIEKIKESVNEGKGMLEPIKTSGLFPPIVVQMVSAGEETGKLEDLLIYVADYYDSQIDYTLKNLVSLIEPFLILFLGCVVTLLALGIFLPMWNLMKVFQG